jgi:UDP:flavonoid glycosyltransferase YjiC (YdhE family)
MTPFSTIRVLVSPLDWGLGHATRCIPVVRELLARGVRVIIASSGSQMALLKIEFPDLEIIEIPGYGIRYSAKKGGLVRGLIFRIPGILRCIRRENAWLKNFCRERRIDAIISDNRYGFYHTEIFSVFITHQLFVETGMGAWANRILVRLNYLFIQRFSECWVPDFPEPLTLAGLLSHPRRLPAITVKYTGILSRFHRTEKGIPNPLLILISGPEPQRTQFENEIFCGLRNYTGAAIVIRGLPDITAEKIFSNKRVVIHNHLASQTLNDIMNRSAIVICRSGYSTIMDLARLRRKALLIPTPGQPEQEYLAKHLDEKNWAMRVSQEAFDLETCLKNISEKTFGFPEFPDGQSLDPLINEFMERLRNFRPRGFQKK